VSRLQEATVVQFTPKWHCNTACHFRTLSRISSHLVLASAATAVTQHTLALGHFFQQWANSSFGEIVFTKVADRLGLPPRSAPPVCFIKSPQRCIKVVNVKSLWYRSILWLIVWLGTTLAHLKLVTPPGTTIQQMCVLLPKYVCCRVETHIQGSRCSVAKISVVLGLSLVSFRAFPTACLLRNAQEDLAFPVHIAQVRTWCGPTALALIFKGAETTNQPRRAPSTV
jgi:hypothetical protein